MGNFTEGEATSGVLVCTAMLARLAMLKFWEPIVAVSAVTGVPTGVVVRVVPL